MGKGTKTYTDGSVYEGPFNHGVRTGLGEYTEHLPTYSLQPPS
jgi:hypothetical protein